MAKNNGIPIEEFDLNSSEESTSKAHEESQLETVEVNTDKRSHAIKYINTLIFCFIFIV